MSAISQFLVTKKTEQSNHNIVSMIYPKGKYQIPPGTEKTRFWDLYSDAWMDTPLGLGESYSQQTDPIPVLIDVDLKKEVFSESELDPETVRLYEDLHVDVLGKVYQKVLREILEMENQPEDILECWIMEKKGYFKKKGDRLYFKNGFHLHFPKIFISREKQESVLLPRIRCELKMLEASQIPECTTPESYIDKSYVKGGVWLLYGSRKEESLEPYLVTHALTSYGVRTDNPLTPLLNYALYNEDESRIVLNEHNLIMYLPRIFSVELGYRKEYVQEIRQDLPDCRSLRTRTFVWEQFSRSEEEICDTVDALLPLLSKERSQDRNDWILVGWALFNIFNGNAQGLERWIQFSKQCPEKFSQEVCEYEWSKITTRNITLGTLKYLARQDNPKEYNRIMNQIMRPYFDKCLKLDGTHHDIAMALFEKYDHEFVCSSISFQSWFQFIDNTWKKIDAGFTLRSKISTEIVLCYEEIGKELMEKMSTCTSDEETSMYRKRINNITKLIRHLKSSPYKTNIMKEAMEVFYDENFSKLLDSNPNLIAFQNGVYDLQEHVFRQGKPSDYSSIRMNINYNPELTMTSESVKAVLDFFEKIFPDASVRDFFLDVSSEVFQGGNSRKMVQIWSGDGDNGKSVTEYLFEKMLGSYSIKLPTSLIVGKRTQSSAACPELVRAGNGVRLAMLQEPDKKDVINIGILKELSGNDSFFARGLYREGQEITPMFKLVLICNEPPKVPHDDKAVWNRIRVIPFESTFTNDAPSDPDEQFQKKIFPKDEHFSQKIPGMVEAFAWYLLERFRTKPKILVEPEKVLLATANYRKRNDIFRQFAEEYILPNNPQDGIALGEMYNLFKDWHKESVPNGTLPTKNDLRDYFVKNWGDPSVDPFLGPMWRGYKLRDI